MTNILPKLPNLMQQILLHDEVADTNSAIIEQHQLNEDQAVAMIGVIRKVILQTIQPAELVSALVHDLGISAEQARPLALDLLGRRFMPMEWYLGGVSEEIRRLGGDPIAFEAEAKRIYPEVYSPQHLDQVALQRTAAQLAEDLPSPYNDDGSERDLRTDEALTETASEQTSVAEPTILHHIDERLTSTKGRAEILLRMTALSQQVEQAAKTGALNDKESQDLLHTLDSLSYAVNTQDLNPLEINAIKRRLKSVVSKIPTG